MCEVLAVVSVVEYHPEDPVGCVAESQTTAIVRQNGLSFHMVDATSSETIVHLDIKGACLMIVTVPDPRSVRKIIANIRLI